MYKRPKSFINDKRIFLLFIGALLVASIVIIRLFTLQVIRGKQYSNIASGRHDIYADIRAERGEIFAKEFGSAKLYPLATNQVTYLVYVEPSKIQNKTKTSELLAEYLNLDKNEIFNKLQKEDPYEPLAHFVSQELMQKIKDLGMLGVGFQEEIKRVYPDKSFGGQILGFVGFDEAGISGKYGLEGYFEKDLAGLAGYLRGEKDALGRIIPGGDQEKKDAEDGNDLILTIDRGIQFFICNKIKEAVAHYEAERGVVIVMEPHSGKIMGMCSSPDYDPNNYNKVEDQNIFNNPAIFYQYEPGSVFKPITVAAALDAGVIDPDTTYEDKGSVEVGPYTIKNSDEKSYGVQTMTQVLEKSLNTGVIHIVKLLGSKKFLDYVESFGFGNLTGIGLDREVVGDISSLKKRGEIWSITASYGQGISVTPIQMLNAFNVLINGGRLMKPYIIEGMIDDNGAIYETKPKVIRQVISSRSSTLMRGMLASVVENGHAKQAAVPGYYVGGKTGTAQVSKKEGVGYEEEKKIATFVGILPVDKPRFTVLVRLDNPEAAEWASSSAAPVFAEIAKYLLQYYKIPPERSI